MYDVLDVSRYVINYSNTKGYGISNLKLQKILYFIQAYFLTEDEMTPCFSDDIKAWDFGPVVPRAYHEYKQYGGGNIPFISSYYTDTPNIWNVERIPFDDTVINKKDKEKINSVVDMFRNTSATDLVTLTHNQAPWKNAYIPGINNTISVESIRSYFNDDE